MLLSGGIDSRLLLGMLREAGADVQSLTFGIPGCEDARVSAEVAKELGTRHRFFELKPDWLAGLAEEAVSRTDGLGNIVNLHVMAIGEQQREHADIVYKGFLGDALLGFALKREMWADYPESTRYSVHRNIHRQQGVFNYERSEQDRLFTDGFLAQIGDGVDQEYFEGMNRSGSSQLANQRLYFDLTQRVPRMTLNGVEVARRWTVVRLPFADNDLVEFVLGIPPGFLFERLLQKAVLVRYYPRLAQIPIAGTGRPLSACARDLMIQARNLASWHLRSRGLGWLSARERVPYKDYKGWFRTILRPWLEDILLASRTLDRGYFRPDYVRELVAAHMSGANHSVRLGALLTIELWHRQHVD
jgi:asparagine synthetase B (glutamine-hydrolysing)